ILSLKSTFFIISALFLAIFGQAQTEPAPKPFITTWQTTSDNETVTIPTTGGGYSYSVNWGENEPADNNTYTEDALHNYMTPGTHTITISGTFPRIFFSGNSTSAQQIRSILQWGDNPWTSMNNAFKGCDNLTIAADAGVPDLSNVTNMSRMFWGSSFTGDISKWDVSSMTDMSYMFNSSPFNGNLSEWNVSGVSNMQSVFGSSAFNQDISTWDISSVTNMKFMFLDNTSMSSENYDKLLIGWSTLDKAAGETKIPSGIIFLAPDKYSCRGKAGRDKLTDTHSWTITGDELIPIRTEATALSEVTAQCEVTANDLTAPTAKNKCDGTGT
ncbi:MAG: DUF285 domain-containing protein, partial [Ekhidna sp.]|nr:DUF285 domain-containing protein [Ekhidna sp.]